jgi:pyruvoyl-dependent arginine decarboxylase (PvlArgDC)
MNPNDKQGKEDRTNAEISFSSLTNEVLRDIARNESNSKEWRKAAVKFLISRNHPYSNLGYLMSLRAEIEDEKKAENDIQDIVETVTEEPLKTKDELRIIELEAEIERLKSITPKFGSSFKSITKEEEPSLLENNTV